MLITINKTEKLLKVFDECVPLNFNEKLSLRILMDVSCVQIWEPNNRISLESGFCALEPTFSIRGDLTINSMRVSNLESIWQK